MTRLGKARDGKITKEMQMVSEKENIDVQAIIKAALARNSEGMILVSSRNPERLRALTSLVEMDNLQR